MLTKAFSTSKAAHPSTSSESIFRRECECMQVSPSCGNQASNIEMQADQSWFLNGPLARKVSATWVSARWGLNVRAAQEHGECNSRARAMLAWMQAQASWAGLAENGSRMGFCRILKHCIRCIGCMCRMPASSLSYRINRASDFNLQACDLDLYVLSCTPSH